VKSSFAKTKATFNKNTAILTGKLDFNLRKKPVKYYIWSIDLYGAETGTLRKVGNNYLESFEMWCWIRMAKISWTHHVRSEEVLQGVVEDRNILHTIKKKKG